MNTAGNENCQTEEQPPSPCGSLMEIRIWNLKIKSSWVLQSFLKCNKKETDYFSPWEWTPFSGRYCTPKRDLILKICLGTYVFFSKYNRKMLFH